MKLFPLAAASLLLTTACAESVPSDATPAEDGGPYNKVDPVIDPMAQSDEEVAPEAGVWTERVRSGQRAVSFGSDPERPLLSLLCDDREGLVLLRQAEPGDGPDLLRIKVGTESSRLAQNPISGEPSLFRIIIPPTGGLIDNFQRSTFLQIEAQGRQLRQIPIDAPVREFVQSCRTDSKQR